MKFLNLFSDKASLSLINRLWREHIKPYRWYVCGGLLCMAIAAMTTAILAKMLQPLFDDVFVARNEAMLLQVAYRRLWYLYAQRDFRVLANL